MKYFVIIIFILGEQDAASEQSSSLTQEKLELEKHISNLNSMLKTITKERDESNIQYQQYAQQLNAQIINLSNRIQQLQQENENLSLQEQNRVKHISELERQLQNLQNQQVAFATTRSVGDGNLKLELENTRELCIQLQVRYSVNYNFLCYYIAFYLLYLKSMMFNI